MTNEVIKTNFLQIMKKILTLYRRNRKNTKQIKWNIKIIYINKDKENDYTNVGCKPKNIYSISNFISNTFNWNKPYYCFI